MKEQIYELIPKGMKMIKAIGKDSVNTQQKYKFRGIDAVYNALNPVMAELGLFIVPEIIDHRREERETETIYNGQPKKTILKYSILTIKYTMYAPDGSNVSCTVVGEGMDSGDKASNKAMSVAMKYAMFQMFMIPTEEMVDPDQESHEITSGAKVPEAPKETVQESIKQPQTPQAKVTVEKVPSLPQTAPKTPENPVLDYLAKERENLREARRIDKAENAALFKKQTEILQGADICPKKKLSEYTMKEAQTLINMMYCKFDPTGTVLKDDGKIA